MAYVTLDSIEELTGQEYDEASQPTLGDANSILEGVAAELDAALIEGGYALPIPSSAKASKALLRQYNLLGGAYRIWDASTKGTQDMPVVERWRADYLRFIDRLEKGKALPDASVPLSEDGGSNRAKIRVY